MAIVIDSDKFDLHKEIDRVVMVAEVSDLTHLNIDELNANTFPEKYFSIRSKRTGQVVQFRLAGVDISGDDVAGWRFTVVPEDSDKCSVPVEVLIIND